MLEPMFPNPEPSIPKSKILNPKSGMTSVNSSTGPLSSNPILEPPDNGPLLLEMPKSSLNPIFLNFKPRLRTAKGVEFVG